MTDRRRRPSRGYSLIEMVLVIGAVSVVLGVCATTLIGLFRIDRAGRAAVNDATTLARLARQFRQDVRAAGGAKRLDDKPDRTGLELTRADGESVVYRVEGKRLVREDRRGDRVGARESYATERLGPVAFGVEEPRVWATLSRRPGEGRALPKPEVRVEARLGKDRELAEPAEAPK